MRFILKVVIVRIIGLVFAVLTAIALAWVFANMGTILAILSGDSAQTSTQTKLTQSSAAQAANPAQLLADATTLVVDNADTLLESKDAAITSAGELQALTDQMNEIIIRCDRKPLDEWPEGDRQKYLELEAKHKTASDSYNSSASKLSQIINELKSDAYQLIEPIAPGLYKGKP